MAMVLCNGADRTLMETRAMILRRAGHTVVPVTGEPELVIACAEYTFDVAVIGQNIPQFEKRRVFSLVREHSPSAKILELYAPYTGRVLAEADDWLEVPAEVPTDLAAHVEKLAAESESE